MSHPVLFQHQHRVGLPGRGVRPNFSFFRGFHDFLKITLTRRSPPSPYGCAYADVVTEYFDDCDCLYLQNITTVADSMVESSIVLFVFKPVSYSQTIATIEIDLKLKCIRSYLRGTFWYSPGKSLLLMKALESKQKELFAPLISHERIVAVSHGWAWRGTRL